MIVPETDGSLASTRRNNVRVKTPTHLGGDGAPSLRPSRSKHSQDVRRGVRQRIVVTAPAGPSEVYDDAHTVRISLEKRADGATKPFGCQPINELTVPRNILRGSLWRYLNLASPAKSKEHQHFTAEFNRMCKIRSRHTTVATRRRDYSNELKTSAQVRQV
jgi:hypothetical protein